MTFGLKFTDLHSSTKERQLQKSCVSFGEECISVCCGFDAVWKLIVHVDLLYCHFYVVLGLYCKIHKDILNKFSCNFPHCNTVTKLILWPIGCIYTTTYSLCDCEEIMDRKSFPANDKQLSV